MIMRSAYRLHLLRRWPVTLCMRRAIGRKEIQGGMSMGSRPIREIISWLSWHFRAVAREHIGERLFYPLFWEGWKHSVTEPALHRLCSFCFFLFFLIESWQRTVAPRPPLSCFTRACLASVVEALMASYHRTPEDLQDLHSDGHPHNNPSTIP